MMTDTTKPEALRLAEFAEICAVPTVMEKKMADELRRQRAEIERLDAANVGLAQESHEKSAEIERLRADASAEQASRQMFAARLENMQLNGEKWLTIVSVLALLNDCDMLAAIAVCKED